MLGYMFASVSELNEKTHHFFLQTNEMPINCDGTLGYENGLET